MYDQTNPSVDRYRSYEWLEETQRRQTFGMGMFDRGDDIVLNTAHVHFWKWQPCWYHETFARDSHCQ